MAQSWSGWCWQLGLASSLSIGGAIASCGDDALAQSNIVGDGTLGAESSVVTPLNPQIDQISGGAIRGANLFHSFLEFNVGEGRGAYFTNPAGIENILSRVTGGKPSNILGTLGVLGGNANLFLINPNGIVFGQNARLDVRGSFLASTASSLKFADGKGFSATEPQTTPLLTVSMPIGLQLGGNPGRILVQGDGQGIRKNSNLIDTPVGLRVQSDQTLALVGGDVALEGGTLKTAGGRIELGSVAGPNLVSLIPTDKGWTLGYEGVQNFQDIQLSQEAAVDASGAGGGDVQVQGKRVTLTDGSQIEATTLTSEPGGTLSVTASELVELIGQSATTQFPTYLVALVYPGATGTGGNVTLKTGRLIVRDGAVVRAGTLGQGKGGNLAVTAEESVELIGTGTSPQGLTPSGLATQSDRVAQTDGAGDAGNLTVATRRLSVRDGAIVSASTSTEGKGGNLTVTAEESVKLMGTSPDRRPSALYTLSSGLSTQTQVAGAAGNLTIATGKLIVQDGARVSTDTYKEGQGGDLAVRASDSVELSGTSAARQRASGLYTQTLGAGAAGKLIVETGRLTVRDEARVSVSSEGSGDAGNLEVAARSIRLDNQGKLTATTESGKGGGNITLQDLDLLLMRRNSEISTNSGGIGNGGDIKINTDLLAALENSYIRGNAVAGRGGNIQINTQGLFVSPDSDITASSQLGINGVVEINTPDIDPSRGLVSLPADLVDVAGLIAQGCPAGGGDVGRGESEFIVTGRGGLPSQPGEALRTSAVVVNRDTLDETGVENRSREVTSTPTQLVEAQGWVVNAQGQVVLTAQAPTVTPHSPWLTPTTCYAP